MIGQIPQNPDIMILSQSILPTVDTVYWIFSTIPQVLAALVGLIVTGVLFYYPSLDKRVETTPEVKDIIDTIKKRLHRYVGFLLISSAVAIVLDILIMRYASFSVSVMTSEDKFICCIPQSTSFWVSLLVNSVPIVALIVIMMEIMSPKFEDDTIEEERKKINRQQEKRVLKEVSEETKGPKIKPKRITTQRVEKNQILHLRVMDIK